MALIKCPDCNKEVSNLANNCNGCGRPISKEAIQAKIQSLKNEAKSSTEKINTIAQRKTQGENINEGKLIAEGIKLENLQSEIYVLQLEL